MRDCLLAPDRTITQCRDTERTQRDAGRFTAVLALVAADATDVVGFETVLLSAGGSTVGGGVVTSGCGAGADAASVGPTATGVVSIGVRAARLSFAALTARAIARSLSSGVGGGAFALASIAVVFGRGGVAFFDAAF